MTKEESEFLAKHLVEIEENPSAWRYKYASQCKHESSLPAWEYSIAASKRQESEKAQEFQKWCGEHALSLDDHVAKYLYETIVPWLENLDDMQALIVEDIKAHDKHLKGLAQDLVALEESLRPKQTCEPVFNTPVETPSLPSDHG